MAFAGIHFVWGYAGGDGNNSAKQPILETATQSETLASAGTTQQATPASDHRRPIVRVRAAADSYVAFGLSPDATLTVGNSSSTARRFVPAGQDYDFYIAPGHKIAWATA